MSSMSQIRLSLVPRSLGQLAQAATNCRRALLKRLRDGDWRAEERSRAKQSEAGRSWAKKINLTFLFVG